MKNLDSSQLDLAQMERQSLELQAALRAHKSAPSPQARERLLEVLKSCFVYIAVQQLPEHLRGAGAFVLQEDTPLVTLASTNARGELMGLIFSDRAQVLARKPDAESIALSAPAAARHALGEEHQGLVIDPAGDWIELTRAETEALAREAAL